MAKQDQKIKISLSQSQYCYLDKLGTKYKAFVGGFGSGKTFIGCLDLVRFALEYPSHTLGYWGPSYPAIRDVFYPTVTHVAELLGLRTVVREGNKEVHLYGGRAYFGTIICRSMDNPGTIIGYQVARGMVDELDTMPSRKATDAWQKVIARARLDVKGTENIVGVTTTPEGFKLTYDLFKRAPTQSYSMVQASTYENEDNLSPDYISSLKETYPPALVEAYIHGEFVNLTSGRVYPQYDRKLNGSTETIHPGEPLYIGLDFNVGNMNAITHVKRDGLPVAVDEITGVMDTPQMVEILSKRYYNETERNEFDRDRSVIIYPDSSGNNRATNNASQTDITLLQQGGFSCVYDPSNPRIKDRVHAMNAMFCNSKGERKYRVNASMCPGYAEDLEQQVFDERGEPDKSSGKDHKPDAAGYHIAYDYPLIKPVSQVQYQWPV